MRNSVVGPRIEEIATLNGIESVYPDWVLFTPNSEDFTDGPSSYELNTVVILYYRRLFPVTLATDGRRLWGNGRFPHGTESVIKYSRYERTGRWICIASTWVESSDRASTGVEPSPRAPSEA